MGKNKSWIILLWFICWWNSSISQPLLSKKNQYYFTISINDRPEYSLLQPLRIKPIKEDVIEEPLSYNENKLRTDLLTAANKYVGVRELTGNNDGAIVEGILKNVNLAKGNPWCAALMSKCYDDVLIPNPHSGYCPDWFRTNVVYKQREITIKPFKFKVGQVFGLYFESKGRVAHEGMIISETKFNYNTIEGNTNGGGSRDGDGCYKMIRNKKSIYVISDHVKNKLSK